MNIESYSLILAKDGKAIFKSEKSGLRPLLECIDRFQSIRNAVLYDKVIGLAAARLIVYSGIISEVNTPVCSKAAKELLEQNKIKINAEKLVDKILNKDRLDICQMEKLADSLTNAAFYQRLKA